MKKLFAPLAIVALLFTSCATNQYTVNVPAGVEVPKNILFVAQSGTQDYLYQTVVDLDNNELVILRYSSANLSTVYRTKMFVNPEDYRGVKLQTSDAPIKEDLHEVQPQ